MELKHINNVSIIKAKSKFTILYYNKIKNVARDFKKVDIANYIKLLYYYMIEIKQKERRKKMVNIEEQLKIFDPTIVLEQSIEKVERLKDGTFKLTSHQNEVHYSKTIIITAGNGAFQPRRLNVDRSEEYEDINLHYYVRDMNI